MTGASKPTIIAAALIAAFVVTGRIAPVVATGEPAAPFWQLQAAGPSARESGDIVRLRAEAREPAGIVVAAR